MVAAGTETSTVSWRPGRRRRHGPGGDVGGDAVAHHPVTMPTRSPETPSSRCSNTDGNDPGSDAESLEGQPPMTSSTSAASATVAETGRSGQAEDPNATNPSRDTVP